MRTRPVLLFSFIFASSCSSCRKKQETFAPMPAPAEVEAVVSLRSIDATFTSASALWQRFSPMPLTMTRSMMQEMLASELGIAAAALEQVDFSKPAHAVLIDGRKIGKGDEGVWAVAIALKNEEKFLEGLRQTRTERVEADIHRFDPKAGGTAVCVAIASGYAVISESPEAIAKAKPFIVGTLVSSPPSQDIEIRLLLDHVFDQPGEWEKLTQGWQNLASGTAPASRILDAVRDTREAAIFTTVSAGGIVVEARFFPKPAGRLRDVIGRARPGDPFAADRLPASSLLVAADRMDASAMAEWATDLKTWLEQSGSAPPGIGPDIDGLASALEGSFSLAMYRTAAAQTGVLILGRATDGKKAAENLDQIGKKVAASLRGTVATPGAKVKSVDFSGLIAAMAASAGAGAAGAPPSDLALAWGVDGDIAALAIGSGAIAETTAALAGARQPSLLTTPVKDVVAAKSGRIGFVYVSVVEAARALSTMIESPSVNKILTETKNARGVLLEWSVQGKDAFSARLDLPADAFLALKPLFELFSAFGGALPIGPGGMGGPGPGMPGGPGGPFQLTPPGQIPPGMPAAPGAPPMPNFQLGPPGQQPPPAPRTP